MLGRTGLPPLDRSWATSGGRSLGKERGPPRAASSHSDPLVHPMIGVMRTFIVPALVAAVVALGIEYLAKPRLEVRKERILARHRDTRTAIGNINSLLYVCGRLSALLESGLSLPGRTQDFRADMLAEAKAYMVVSARTDLRINQRVESVLILFAAACETCFIFARKSVKDADDFFRTVIDPMSDHVGELLDLHGLRWRKRRILVRSIESLHEAASATNDR
jgi:hypothetical protein